MTGGWCYPHLVRSFSTASIVRGVGLLASLVFMANCGGETERPPPFQWPESMGGSVSSFGGSPGSVPSSCDPIPEVDDEGACDSETINLLQKKPTIYFVVDTSGSMRDRVVSGSDTKLEAAQEALLSVVEEVGHRIKYGLATFPGPALSEDDLEEAGLAWGCEPGEERFDIHEGDERTCVNRPARGPVYEDFAWIVSRLRANGKTPLAPTLDLVAPSLLREENDTTVILLTDGHPNCGKTNSCAAELCPFTGYYSQCTEDFNCCEDGNIYFDDPHPSSFCIDGPDSVEQVEQLRVAGIDTYVVGLLGDTDFDDVMNELAVAGGQAREGDRAYYDVDSLEELTDVVRSIGTKIAQSCTIELTDRPPDANTLNVYFDGQVVPYGDEDGWSVDDDVVTIHGQACDRLTAGKVLQVRLISGCETIIR